MNLHGEQPVTNLPPQPKYGPVPNSKAVPNNKKINV